MSHANILAGKRILAVDDEQDVLDLIEEQLRSCNLVTANNYETARRLLEEGEFDLTILDIMGVRGFDLLRHARANGVPAVMLTAHSMNAESLQRSADYGAVSFLPKEEIHRLDELIAEILRDLAQGRPHWPKLEQRLGNRFKKEWGELWERIKFPRDLDID